MKRLKSSSEQHKKHGYTPVKGNSNKKKKQKKGTLQRNLVLERQPTEVALKGLDIERENMRWKNFAYIVAFIIGTILCFFDYRDDGMVFEVVGAFKYSGSLVGILAIVIGLLGLIRNKTEINIRN